jgi:hypothetical protein
MKQHWCADHSGGIQKPSSLGVGPAGMASNRMRRRGGNETGISI